MSSRYIKGTSFAKKPISFQVKNRKLLETYGCVGQCCPGYDHVIEVDPRQCPRDYLDTVIHEALHELFPKGKEPDILNAGTSIANLLWRLGYRKKS